MAWDLGLVTLTSVGVALAERAAYVEDKTIHRPRTGRLGGWGRASWPCGTLTCSTLLDPSSSFLPNPPGQALTADTLQWL